jgi:hypothetical protein
MNDDRISISQAAKLLDRSPHTLRSWDRNKSMPKDLRPKRDELGHRYWTLELIEKIKLWIVDNDFHPGNGIDYHPSPQRLQQHIGRIRVAAANPGTSVNGHTGALHDMIVDALNNHNVAPENIIKMLPGVVEKVNHDNNVEITLDEALEVASQTIRATTATR